MKSNQKLQKCIAHTSHLAGLFVQHFLKMGKIIEAWCKCQAACEHGLIVVNTRKRKCREEGGQQSN